MFYNVCSFQVLILSWSVTLYKQAVHVHRNLVIYLLYVQGDGHHPQPLEKSICINPSKLQILSFMMCFLIFFQTYPIDYSWIRKTVHSVNHTPKSDLRYCFLVSLLIFIRFFLPIFVLHLVIISCNVNIFDKYFGIISLPGDPPPSLYPVCAREINTSWEG